MPLFNFPASSVRSIVTLLILVSFVTLLGTGLYFGKIGFDRAMDHIVNITYLILGYWFRSAVEKGPNA